MKPMEQQDIKRAMLNIGKGPLALNAMNPTHSAWTGRWPKRRLHLLRIYQVTQVAPIPLVDIVDRKVHELHLRAPVKTRIRVCSGGWFRFRVEAGWCTVCEHICATVCC